MESISEKLNIPQAAEYLALLRERLSDKTLNHTLSVAEYMAELAPKAGITNEQAVTAGLLHDACKAMKKKELLEAVDAYNLTLTDGQRERPALLHGPVAAEEARRTLGLTDPDVYEAIYWHTTGIPEWAPTGLALYVADFSEPLRTLPEAAEARAIVERDGFIEGLKFVVTTKTAPVREKYTLDPVSEAFANWVAREFGG